MASKPLAVLAMAPLLTGSLRTPALLERLAGACDVPDPEPLPSFDDPRADELLPRAEVLVTGWGCPPIDAAVLDRAPALRFVGHAAGTVKNHVTDTCFERGLRVVSAADANAVPVAEYTVAAILAANKRLFRLQRLYAEKRTWRPWVLEVPPLGNYRRVVGVVGASRIGRRVLGHLRGFDFELLLCDPLVSPAAARELGAELVDLDTLLERSDVVSLHAPLLPETRGLIDAARLARMRDGSVLVNTARGGLVDGEALERELVSGRIDAVVDTTEPEVLPADSPLYSLPNVFLTPHVAGAMGAETERMLALVIDELERFLADEPLRHEVRAADLPHIA